MAFIGAPLGRRFLEVVAAIAAVALVVGYIYHAGVKAEVVKDQKVQAAAAADVKAHEASASGISAAAQSNLQKVQTATVTKYRTLVQRVPVDVPEGADRDCVIPSGFVSLWNAGVQP